MSQEKKGKMKAMRNQFTNADLLNREINLLKVGVILKIANYILVACIFLLSSCADFNPKSQPPIDVVDLSPLHWMDDYENFLQIQSGAQTSREAAVGEKGAVTVARNGLAARAGLEALKQGGTAADAALTAAITQVALDAGVGISYFGVMSLVFYDAQTKKISTLNADWNTVKAESEPLTIPGGAPMTPDGQLTDIEPSGRTALIGGFMKGVEEVHNRFGRLPFQEIFQPAIYVAQNGIPVSEKLAWVFDMRQKDLARLPETRKTYFHPDNRPYEEGEVFKQPALAKTLIAVSEQGADYMYSGAWAKKLVEIVQAEGGLMAMEDLKDYQVKWAEPLTATLNGFELHTMPPPVRGGLMMIQAQKLAEVSGLVHEPHWSTSGPVLKKALDLANVALLDFMSEERIQEILPGLEWEDSLLMTSRHAEKLWKHIEDDKLPFKFVSRPTHSDVVIAADAEGNIAALVHSINSVLIGKTAIVVDGVTIGDPGSFSQRSIAKAGPGNRLPTPAEVGILTKNGVAVLGFGSMGNGMHHKPFQGLINYIWHGMGIDEAINAPDFFFPEWSSEEDGWLLRVPEGRFSNEVLWESEMKYKEIPIEESVTGGQGIFVGLSRDPKTGELKAAPHNRGNSAAAAH